MYSSYTAKTASGPRRQFGPRRSPERFECYHRARGPTRPYENTHIHLGRTWGRTGYVAHGHFLLYKMRYNGHASPRGPCVVSGLLYSAIHYTGIHHSLCNTPLLSSRSWDPPIKKGEKEHFALGRGGSHPTHMSTGGRRELVLNSTCTLGSNRLEGAGRRDGHPTRYFKVARRPSWPTKAAKAPRPFCPETEDLFAKSSCFIAPRVDQSC